jgi:cytochrome b
MQKLKNIESSSNKAKLMIWDFPTRLFHWLLVLSFTTAWLTRDDRYLDIHIFSGSVIGGLIIFRILWGVIGGRYSRFSDFCFRPNEVVAYLREALRASPPEYVGHNPAGSWAIYLMLLSASLIVTTGFFAFGEEQHGPFAGWLNFPQAAVAHAVHEGLAWLLLTVVGVHVCGVLVETLLHRVNLIGSMITGVKFVDSSAHSVEKRNGIGYLMLLTVLMSGVGWFYGYIVETPEAPYRPFVGKKLPDYQFWRDECGACHLAFHPSLLPRRSWNAIMSGQSDHFGDDLYLDEDAVKEINSFLMNNSAEQLLTEAAWKISQSIPEDETPLRITKSFYWREKHKEITDDVWASPQVNGKVNCGACHLDADVGTFEDAAIRIPAVKR